MAVPLSWRSAVVVPALAGVVVGATGAGPIDGVATPAGPLGLWSAASTGRVWYAGLAFVSLGALAMLFVHVYRRAAARRLGVRAHLDALVTGLAAGVLLAIRRGHWALAGAAAAVARPGHRTGFRGLGVADPGRHRRRLGVVPAGGGDDERSGAAT